MHEKDLNTTSTADREISATRVFDAPRELVWKVWTDPKHIAQWWGPNGFTNIIHEMDVRPGGVWRLIMHGPNGVDYQNKNVFVEIEKPERIVYDHVSAPRHHVTVTFAEQGDKTQITMRMLFDTAAERDDTARKFGAVEGLSQTLGRLKEHLAKFAGLGQNPSTTNPNEGVTMQVQPYLFFDGRCEEAIQFYKKALGAEVQMLMRFKDSPEPPNPDCMPVSGEMVMHASFRIGSTMLMASDGQGKGQASFKGFSLSLTVPKEADADRLFAALSDGGQVQMPLAKTFFSPRFGMVADRFGVSWMIYVAPEGTHG
jgi:PhnB protein